MRCKECGESARNPHLRYCENCGAKMPPPPGASIRKTGRTRNLPAAVVRTAPTPEDAEDTNTGRTAPPYDGPSWLAHVPGHSPSVAGVGLLAMALVLSLLPFFAGVGPFWSQVVFAGGWLVTARELHAAGERHPLVDWVPEPLLHPAVPAVYAVVTAGLALRMLGVGLTPLLWLGGAGLLGHDQYRKVYAGERGWSRLFEPRQLLRGTSPVALGGVALCLAALFLTWTPVRPSTDVVYNPLTEPMDTGWELPLSVWVELLLLAVLGLLALRPEVPRPGWLRFAPIAVVVLGLVWTLVYGQLLLGPVLFLAGLGAVGFASVYQAFARQE